MYEFFDFHDAGGIRSRRPHDVPRQRGFDDHVAVSAHLHPHLRVLLLPAGMLLDLLLDADLQFFRAVRKQAQVVFVLEH